MQVFCKHKFCNNIKHIDGHNIDLKSEYLSFELTDIIYDAYFYMLHFFLILFFPYIYTIL